MSKTFKKCTIFAISMIWLLLVRMLTSVINLSDNLSDWLFSFAVQIVGLGIIPLVLFKYWVKEDVIKGFSLNVKINPTIYIIAVCIGFLLHFAIRAFSGLWQTVVILMGYTPTNSGGTIYSSPEVLVMSIVCTALLPGFFEEFTYRGLGLSMLENVKDEKTVIVIIALLFGLGHQFILQTGYAFIAGIVFAYVAIKSKSIVPGMIIHFINNAYSTISDYCSQKQNGLYEAEKTLNEMLFGSYGMLIATFVVSGTLVAALAFAIKKINDKNSTKQDDNSEMQGTVFFSNKAQYVDNLFGQMFFSEVSEKKKVRWYEYAFLIGAVAMMAASTVMTFIWGFTA